MLSITSHPSRAGAAFVVEIESTNGSGSSGINLYREANGDGNWVKIYSGDFASQFLDTGEGFQTSLDQNASYVYKVEDSSTPTDNAVSASIKPVSLLKVEKDIVAEQLIKIFKSAVRSLAVPENFANNIIEVTHALPLDRTPRFPFITINLEYTKQSQTGIGFLEPIPMNEPYVIETIQMRRFVIEIFTQSVEEREFLRDAVVAIFYGMGDLMRRIGWAISYDWQATQSQVEGGEGKAPGFYNSSIMLDMEGMSAVTITSDTSSEGVISTIDQTFNTHRLPDESIQP